MSSKMHELKEKIKELHDKLVTYLNEPSGVFDEAAKELEVLMTAYLHVTDSLRVARNDFERTFILEKLAENGWNVSKTAEILGIERSHLHRKLKLYDVDKDEVA